MRVSILGAGYVGLVTGACLAEVGHQICVVDVDEGKIERLHRGILPIYERGLDELVERGRESGELQFTTSSISAIRDAQVIMIAVGTPPLPDGSADLSQVKSAAEAIGRAMDQRCGHKLIVLKSTAPVGTTRKLEAWIRAQQPYELDVGVVSNPEFLREGTAVHDTFQMSRIVIGSDNEEAAETVRQMYQPFSSPIFVTTLESAEMTKYASNAFLATKISFINEISRLCEYVGADVTMVAKGMGMDPRIQPQCLQAGVGYGGPCLPKDLRVLLEMGKESDIKTPILEAVQEGNRRQRIHLIKKLETALGGLWVDKTVAILGLTFKPFTDDMRGAPSIEIIQLLKDRGASLRLYDPLIQTASSHIFSQDMLFSDPYEALAGVDAAMILTEWPDFFDLDWSRIKANMRAAIVVDGRNVCQVSDMEELGFIYESIGRPQLSNQ